MVPIRKTAFTQLQRAIRPLGPSKGYQRLSLNSRDSKSKLIQMISSTTLAIAIVQLRLTLNSDCIVGNKFYLSKCPHCLAITFSKILLNGDKMLIGLMINEHHRSRLYRHLHWKKII